MQTVKNYIISLPGCYLLMSNRDVFVLNCAKMVNEFSLKLLCNIDKHFTR